MNSARLLIAAGTVAATLAGVVPVVNHGSASPARASDGVVLRATDARSTLVVPQGAHVLTGLRFGSARAAAGSSLQVVRASDGATLFTGSLGTFHTLPVLPGTKLVIRVQKPSVQGAESAGATLRFG